MPETRRGSFCSDGCEHESKVRSSPDYARRAVFERDGGICALCGLDTEAEQQRLESLERQDPQRYEDEKAALGIPDHRVTFWDMDHIVPVVEGGGQCGLAGYRTLCIWCHAEITADLNRKLAKERNRPRVAGLSPVPKGITAITVARKPLSGGSVVENVLKWETGGLNIGSARLASSGDHKRPFQPTNQDREVYGAQTGFQPTNADGRWPSNIVFGHRPGCRCDGTREVKSGVAVGRYFGEGAIYGGGQRLKGQPKGKELATYANPKTGQETVPNWICTPGCPVADLDAQSGSSQSRKGQPRKGATGQGWGMSHTGSEYDDQGGASRYFKQVKSDD